MMPSIQEGLPGGVVNKTIESSEAAIKGIRYSKTAASVVSKAMNLVPAAGVGLARGIEAVYAFKQDRDAEYISGLLRDNKAAVLSVSPEHLNRYLDFLKESDLAFVDAVYRSIYRDRKDDEDKIFERNLIIIPEAQKEYAKELRMLYALANQVAFSCPDMNTLRKFGAVDERGIHDLTSTELDIYKDYMRKAGIIFNAEKNIKGLYDLDFLSEDRPAVDIIKATVNNLKKSNAEYFEVSDKIRDKKEKVIADILTNPKKDFLVSNENLFLCVNSQGLLIRYPGSDTEFYSRRDSMFRDVLSEKILSSDNISIVEGDKAKELSEELKNRNYVISLWDSFSSLHVKNLKEFEEKEKKIKNRIDKKPSPAEQDALYRAKVALDIVHARQDATPEVSKNLKDQFDAESLAKRAVALCLCSSTYGGAMVNYVSMDDIDEYVQGRTEDDRLREYEELGHGLEEKEEKRPVYDERLERKDIVLDAFIDREWYERAREAVPGIIGFFRSPEREEKDQETQER